MRRIVIGVALLAVSCGPGGKGPTTPNKSTPPDAGTEVPVAKGDAPKLAGWRLPEGVRPAAYQLELELDATKDTFTGKVEITVEVDRATDAIWLHAADIELDAIAIDASDALVAKGEGDLRGLWTGKPIDAGLHAISIRYTGKARHNDIGGLFRQEEAGRWYLYSQGEAIYARRTVPCFDEPRFKVPWTVAITAPADQRAYSNALAVSDEPLDDGRHKVTMAATPAIPSYLLAIAVGPFEEVDAGKVGKNNLPARIIVPAGRSADAATAAKQIPLIVAALERYFDMALPFDKVDSIAIPSFFGAMENPGLVTYDAGIILSPPGQADDGFRMRMIAVAAHELAHQWFGDYVTLAWWDDLWLNESFATWMADKIIAELEPTWDAATRVIETSDRAMSADGRVAAQPLHRTIAAEQDIEAGFDAIAYDKGGAVLTMFERWIGADAFRDGVRKYMAAHARGSATAADFVNALVGASTAQVGDSFHAYLDQPGVAVVDVSLASCDKSGARVHLHQHRLVDFGETAPADLWPIRACLRHGGKKGAASETCTELTGADADVELDKCPAWIAGNAGAAGYYRVHYDDALAGRLQKHLKRVPPVERMGYASDVSALLRAGQISASDALALVPSLLATKDDHDLSSAVDLVEATGPIVDDATVDAWRTWVLATFGKAARAAPLDPPKKETPAAHDARVDRLHLVGVVARDAKLSAAAAKRIAPWIAGKESAPADGQTLLAIAARHGDAKLFDAILERAKTADGASKGDLLAALGYFTDPALLARAQELVVGGTIDLPTAGAILQGMLESRDGAASLGAFVRDRWDALAASLPRMVLPYLVYMQGGVCDDAARTTVEEFGKTHVDAVPNGVQIFAETLASIDACIARRAALGADVTAAIKRR